MGCVRPPVQVGYPRHMGKTILIIEDEVMLGELYQVVLSQAGYTTHWAKDGEEGLVLAKAQPDLILLDIMMPKMNGIDVLKHLRADESTKNIAVIILTMNDSPLSIISVTVVFCFFMMSDLEVRIFFSLKNGPRYRPVCETLHLIISSGGPEKTTSPPLSPPSGPRSII